MRRRRIIWCVMAVPVAAFGCAAVYAWRSWSPGAPVYDGGGLLSSIVLPHRMRNSHEHDAALARTGNPYVLEINTDTGSLLYYGAEHATDQDHPQVADIRARWAAFAPTVALCEGRARGYMVGRLFEAGGLPEPMLVHQLARRDGVTLYSLEPAYQDEVAALLKTWSAEQIALYFTMRVYWTEAGGQPNNALAEDLLARRTDVEGLRGALTTASDIDAIWRRDFPDHGDWHTRTTEPDETYLAEIGDDSRRVRGEHMARTLIDLVNRGERVLAVVGSGHVIRQEWTLRAAFGAEPAWDQP